MRNLLCVLAVFLTCTAERCESRHYSALTVINADGSVERSILQSADTLPSDARRDGWLQVMADGTEGDLTTVTWPAKRLVAKGTAIKIPDEGAPPLVAARGRFPSVGAIPDHVVLPKDVDSAPALVRTLDRKDFGLVVQYRWAETLQDVVTVQDMLAAEKDTVDFYADLLKEAFKQPELKAYDAAPLFTWLDTKGKPCIVEALGVRRWVTAAATQSALAPGANDVTVATAARCGVILAGQAGAQDAFFADRLATLVKVKATGKLLGPVVAKEWMDDSEKTAPDGKPASKAPPGPLRAAFDRVIAPLEDKASPLSKRKQELERKTEGRFSGADKFDYTATLPGRIVRANGDLLGPARVRWHFDAETVAATFGYSMTATSLLPQTAVQTAMGTPAMTDAEPMLRYVELMERSTDVGNAVAESIKQKKWDALKALRKTARAAAAVKDPPAAALETTRVLDALFPLLGLKD